MITKSEIEQTQTQLQSFLAEKDNDYKNQINKIDLFNPEKTKNFTDKQKKRFAEVFYHLRGHFIDFMWFLANFSEDEAEKKIIFSNIQEEIGLGSKYSHEKLYQFFAQSCGADIIEEIVHEPNYLPFAKKFNKTHIEWIASNPVEERFAAFAAYERLDNIDYPFLLNFVETLNLPSKATTFFRVHIFVEHFNSTLEKILPLWETSPEKISKAFNFIYPHQLNMWQQLSDTIFAIA